MFKHLHYQPNETENDNQILTLFNSRYGTPGSITKEYEEFSEYYCKSFAGKSVGS